MTTSSARAVTASEPVIVAEGIGKVYHLHDRRDSLLQSFFMRLIGKMPPREENWALRDVTFSVHRGDWLAVVGANGSGKTTLLKILAGIARASTGSVEVRAAAATQFALGAGFHPYLSGRENVFLQGTILGMTNAEVRELFPQIIEFAGLDGAIDRPLWTYSNGMMARLGFAVAAHSRPELLILDEALSAGDAAFREQCAQTFRDLRAKGVTVVMVSHAMADLRELCDRALWLDHGRVCAEGTATEIVSQYELFVRGDGRKEAPARRTAGE
jgi:ABC-type polysaccharide/polyol phosphate transport system ATPase subunit